METTTAILIIAILALVLIAALVSLWRDTHKPKPRHWQEWDKPMIVDRYSWITKVDTRPLDERDYGDEDREGRE